MKVFLTCSFGDFVKAELRTLEVHSLGVLQKKGRLMIDPALNSLVSPKSETGFGEDFRIENYHVSYRMSSSVCSSHCKFHTEVHRAHTTRVEKFEH